MSGLRQVVLALRTLSNDGCKSLQREKETKERKKMMDTGKGDKETIRQYLHLSQLALEGW